MPDEKLPLPDSTVLLHIGPHKTGTTAIQGSLAQGREDMLRHGVLYPAKTTQHRQAALAVTGAKGAPGRPPASPKLWKELVVEVALARDKRVIVSSEVFCEADDDGARVVVDKLGSSRVHVLVTLRPLYKIMPSQWQQYARNRLRMGYEDWLDAMMCKPPYNTPTPTFWKRHHHEALVARWAEVVGPKNVTVFVADDVNPLALMRTVEGLTGLPHELLQPVPGRVNRSLTLGEIELVRHLNIEFVRHGWSESLYHTYVRQGVVRGLQNMHEPGPDEPPIPTPDWALDRAAEIGAKAAAAIESSGVHVVGDLAALGRRPARTSDGTAAPTRAVLPADAAMKAVAGTILAGITVNAPASSNGSAKPKASRPALVRRARRVARRAGARIRPRS